MFLGGEDGQAVFAASSNPAGSEGLGETGTGTPGFSSGTLLTARVSLIPGAWGSHRLRSPDPLSQQAVSPAPATRLPRSDRPPPQGVFCTLSHKVGLRGLRSG